MSAGDIGQGIVGRDRPGAAEAREGCRARRVDYPDCCSAQDVRFRLMPYSQRRMSGVRYF